MMRSSSGSCPGRHISFGMWEGNPYMRCQQGNSLSRSLLLRMSIGHCCRSIGWSGCRQQWSRMPPIRSRSSRTSVSPGSGSAYQYRSVFARSGTPEACIGLCCCRSRRRMWCSRSGYPDSARRMRRFLAETVLVGCCMCLCSCRLSQSRYCSGSGHMIVTLCRRYSDLSRSMSALSSISRSSAGKAACRAGTRN